MVFSDDAANAVTLRLVLLLLFGRFVDVYVFVFL